MKNNDNAKIFLLAMVAFMFNKTKVYAYGETSFGALNPDKNKPKVVFTACQRKSLTNKT